MSINPRALAVSYAVRGEIALRAAELSKSRRVFFCNIGNPQQLGQHPLTFVRQLVALTEFPGSLGMPADVCARHRELLADGSFHAGAYSDSRGLPLVREQVALFIRTRDGVECSASDIFLTNGASAAAQAVLNLLLAGSRCGVLVPVPEYPLYSATISLLGGQPVHYYLREGLRWSLDADELQRAFEGAAARGISVRAMVLINPGNPTGNVLSVEELQQCVSFCVRNQIALIADEVYQANVFTHGRPFVSARKIAAKSRLWLFSLHSVSKGVFGECGKRGGYVECFGVPPHALETLYKLLSITLCSSVPGQLALSAMVAPPQLGDESYEQFGRETHEIHESLRARGRRLCQHLNTLPGVCCAEAEGALYLFPRLELPAAAVRQAQRLGLQPDELYCRELLESAGICVVPGSGFGQQPGTFHFRTTFLPPLEDFGAFSASLARFHHEFMARRW